MFQNIPSGKVLDVLKEGPSFPAKIAKQVGGDTMIIGAVLSTLISQGHVRVSTLKIGGSPLYFIPGDEEKLEQFIDHLNQKDRITFNLIKDKNVLRDSVQEPLTRVSLRAIKDFAKQFEIEVNGKKELFWRYHLLPLEEALPLGKNIIAASGPMLSQPSAETGAVMLPPVQSAVEAGPYVEPVIAASSKKEHTRKETHHETLEGTKASAKEKEDFFETIKKHIASKNLDIISKEKIKKSDYSLVLKNHDANEYIYCKAKDKKSINEGDLASAYVFAQNKKMPCMFMTTGSLTKKAESMISKEFSGLTFERIA